LNDEEFEDLVTRICRKILGAGTTSFEKGRDGGKDAKFVGTANCFPSNTSPLSGNAVIQAKHTTDPTKSCSDNDFENNKTSILNEEIPKIKKQVEKESVTHYLLFTNRKKTGGAETSPDISPSPEFTKPSCFSRSQGGFTAFLCDFG